jgi:hypothetical protein
VAEGSVAANNARCMRRSEIEFADALLSTGRSAVASAAATALAGATASAMADQGALRLPFMFGWAPPFSPASTARRPDRGGPIVSRDIDNGTACATKPWRAQAG